MRNVGRAAIGQRASVMGRVHELEEWAGQGLRSGRSAPGALIPCRVTRRPFCSGLGRGHPNRKPGTRGAGSPPGGARISRYRSPRQFGPFLGARPYQGVTWPAASLPPDVAQFAVSIAEALHHIHLPPPAIASIQLPDVPVESVDDVGHSEGDARDEAHGAQWPRRFRFSSLAEVG